MRYLLILVAIAACKSGSAAPAAKSELVTKLDALADRMCKCADGACADEVAAAVDDLAAHTTDVAEEDFGPAQAAQAKIDQCQVQHSKIVGDYLALMDEICACTDKTCADKVAAKVAAWSTGVQKSGAKLRPALVNAITERGKAAVACFEKLDVAIPR
jgi:hypothetical protein